MSEICEMFTALRKGSAAKRMSNREASATILDNLGVVYETNNQGVHLKIMDAVTQECVVDFWPGTGLWHIRKSGCRNRGVQKLVDYLRKEGVNFETPPQE